MRLSDRLELEKLGPEYPTLNGPVTKYRAKARKGLKFLSANDRQAYGAAVGDAIRALQHREAFHGLAPANPKSGCASGTWHADGDSIHKAIRLQHLNALLACPAQERRARSPNQWAEMYDAAMKKKRSAMQ